MSSSNLQYLTRQHNIVAAKRRAKRDQVNEILFDEDARRQFLTGFHKRKQAKVEAAKRKAKEREKQDRLRERREQREALRERARENALLVEKAYGGQVDEDSEKEWSGITSASAGPDEEEYEGEETLATVTIVEDFDPESALYGPMSSQLPTQQEQPLTPPAPKGLNTRTHSQPALPIHKKSQKVRYQTKAARKAERKKQFARKAEKAELAGGKASRKLAARKRGSSRR
ncbi:hypothetical protein AX16_010687 [Volvariella volvacea WC 439]|nr:hypothetical protein AX16_010687 [Volvariella volvacea WC 439]